MCVLVYTLCCTRIQLWLLRALSTPNMKYIYANSIRIQIFKLNQCLYTIIMYSVKIDRSAVLCRADQVAAAAKPSATHRGTVNLSLACRTQYVRKYVDKIKTE